MSEKAYTLFNAIGSVDEGLIIDMKAYFAFRKRSRILRLSAAVAACIAVLSVALYLNVFNVNQDIEYDHQAQINYSDSFFELPGGKLCEVNKETWTEHFDDEYINCGDNAKFYLNYSDEADTVYGAIELYDEAKEETYAVNVSHNILPAEEYDRLKKTPVNGRNIAVFEFSNGGYGALFQTDDTLYSTFCGRQTDFESSNSKNDENINSFISRLKSTIR